MRNFRDRLIAAWAAFTNSKAQPLYAVIYDSFAGLEGSEPREEHYQAFNTPQEAHAFFRSAFPSERKLVANGSLVMILGDIDAYSTEGTQS